MALPALFEFDGGWFGLVIGALILGAVAGFLVARWLMKKQLKENPPINENMIRAMFRSMGRKPSEAQIRAVMKSMEQESNR
ncbi:MAG TPA: hypothetical protein DEA63_00415 [Firmicutes bacterium]|nr:hypothetical protein [Bacillota bacterium]